MPSELNHDQLPLVSSLLDDIQFDHAWIEAAISEPENTRIFVDDHNKPDTALLAYRDKIGFLLGRAQSSSIVDILGYIRTLDEIPVHINTVGLQSEDLAEPIRDHFGPVYETSGRKALHLVEGEYKMAPVECDVRLIDQELAQRIPSELHQGFAWYWPDAQKFTDQSIGFCLLQDNRIVCTAYSVFVPRKYLEIEVVTAEDCRGQGFTTKTCAPLLNYCHQKTIEPLWNTDTDNLASLAVARKLGFRESGENIWLAYKPWNACTHVIPSTRLADYEGNYSWGETKVAVFQKEDQLWIRFSANEADPTLKLLAKSDTQFGIEGYDALLSVETGSDGRVCTMMLNYGGGKHIIKRIT